MEYLIRQANSKDASGIAKIKVETWRTHYRGQISDDYLDKLSVEELAKKWQERLDNQKAKTAIFVAANNDGMLGFCWVGPARDEEEVNSIGEVYAIYTGPNQQGKGIGSDLMKTGLDYLRKEGFKKAKLWVLKTNESSIKFYEAKGWKANGEEKIDKKDNVVLNDVGYSIEF